VVGLESQDSKVFSELHVQDPVMANLAAIEKLNTMSKERREQLEERETMDIIDKLLREAESEGIDRGISQQINRTLSPSFDDYASMIFTI